MRHTQSFPITVPGGWILFVYGKITAQPGHYWMTFVEIVSFMYLVSCQAERLVTQLEAHVDCHPLSLGATN